MKKRKITLTKVLIAFIIISGFILIVVNLFRGEIIEKYEEERKETPIHKCIDSSHSSCDGNCECDGLGCSSGINPDDSLIADETYIVTDTIGIGYTLNQEIANILIDQGCKITFIDGNCIWFSYTENPQL